MMTQPLYCTMDITVGLLWLTSTASKPLGYAPGDAHHFSSPRPPHSIDQAMPPGPSLTALDLQMFV